MTPRIVRRRIAAHLGLAGAALGMIAGAIQAAVGSRIADWSGNKASPVALGLLTMFLSAVAGSAAILLRSPDLVPANRRTVAAIGLVVPAALCFSTVGRLWYPPGALMLSAVGWVFAAGGVHELATVIRSNWTRGLVSLLGAFEILMAVSAGDGIITSVGVIGGAALIAAPWLHPRVPRARLGLLIVGSVPFAVLTWWSLVSPLLAIAAVVIGLTAAGHRHPPDRTSASHPGSPRRAHAVPVGPR